MTRKIFNSMVAVSAIVLLICVTAISVVLYDYFGDIIRSELKYQAILISQHIKDIDEYSSNADLMENRVSLIDADGTVLFDSKADEAQMENHSSRDEIKLAAKEGEAYAERYSDTLSTKTIYYARQLDDGKILRISQQQSTVVNLLKGIIGPVLLIFFVVIMIALLISRVVSGKLLKPINEMDLQNENAEEPYPELAPLMKKIKEQNRYIASQMDELKRKQKEFTAITEHMSEGFLLIDNDSDILSYNNAAIELLGKNIHDVPRKALELNRSKSFRATIEKVLQGKHVQIPHETENKYYNIIANPVTVEGGVAGAVIMLVDMTEKEQREKLRREFTSNVSHELKTPLTTIYGVSDMMAEGIVKPEDIVSFATNIKNESSRMITLIDDIIKLSRLDESSEDDELYEIDLFDIAEEVVKRLEFKASEKCISIKLAGEHVKIMGIPSLCSEIIYNLSENAIKYNREGGTVNISIADENGHAVIAVEDTGIGIAYENRERIFERFFRVDKSRSQKVDGTGLGLSIVKHAVQRMNGKIGVESVLGEGTEITITLPKANV